MSAKMTCNVGNDYLSTSCHLMAIQLPNYPFSQPFTGSSLSKFCLD